MKTARKKSAQKAPSETPKQIVFREMLRGRGQTGETTYADFQLEKLTGLPPEEIEEAFSRLMQEQPLKSQGFYFKIRENCGVDYCLRKRTEQSIHETSRPYVGRSWTGIRLKNRAAYH